MPEQAQKPLQHSGIKSNAQETTSPEQIAAPAKSVMPPPLRLQAIPVQLAEDSEEKAESEQEAEKATIQQKKAIQAGAPANPGDDPNEYNKASGYFGGDNQSKTVVQPFQLKPDNTGYRGIAPENFSNQSFISATQKNPNQQPGENLTANIMQAKASNEAIGTSFEKDQELTRDFETETGSRAIIVGSDKWSHIYLLDDFTVKELKGMIGDDYGYLLTKGAGVSATKVRTKDGFELSYGTGRTGTGWRYLQILSELEQFSIGAIIGDFSEDPTATELMGQIIMGVVPIAGQIADARDTIAAIKKLWQSGGKEGKVQFAFTLVAWIPLIGDGMKAAYKAGGKKAASNLLRESVETQKAAFSKRLSNEIAENPTAWAKKFGLDDAAAETAEKSIKDAFESGSKEAIEKIAKELVETYTKNGNSAFAVINKAGGKWKNAVKVLEKSAEGTHILQQMEAFRIAQFDGMVGHLGKNAQKSGADVALSGRPHFERTGTPSYKSDFDGSFLGPNASFYKERAEDYMSSRFGNNWRETFDADIFTDPSRLHLYADATKNLPGGAAAAIEKRVVQDAELNVLAKMLNSGVDLQTVSKKAAELGVDMAALTRRQKELQEISESYLAGLLRKGHTPDSVKKQAAEMGVDFNNVLKKEIDGTNAIREMELKMDTLHNAYMAAKEPSKRAELAEEMAKIQGKLNASIPGPYMTPGGVMKHTTRRDPALRQLLNGTEFSPSMAYMQVMDDYYMLVTALPPGKVFDEKSAKSFAKYADRLMITAGRFGAVDAGAASARGQFDDIFALLQRARIEGKEADLKSKNDFLELLIKITNKIEENGGQYKKPRTEAIESEYVDDQRRATLIDGLQKSLRLQQRGSSLDNALQQAAERTKAYSEWKEKTRRREDEVGDYVDTKEYAEYKKLRVKQLDSAITGKELTAI